MLLRIFLGCIVSHRHKTKKEQLAKMMRWVDHELLDDLRETKRHRHVDTTKNTNKPYLPGRDACREIMETDPQAARWLPHGRNFPTDGTPWTEYQEFFAGQLGIAVDLLSNETMCIAVQNNTTLNKGRRLDRKAICVCNHVIAALCINVALGSRSGKASLDHRDMETICNETFREGHVEQNRAFRMMAFFNFLRYLSPYIEVETWNIFHKNVNYQWKMREEEFFHYGLYHENWLDLTAAPPRNFTEKRFVDGIYYPHFKALDSIWHRFRYPGNGRMILTGINEPFRIGYDEQYDFDRQPDRPYSSDTHVEGRVNERIPHDVY